MHPGWRGVASERGRGRGSLEDSGGFTLGRLFNWSLMSFAQFFFSLLPLNRLGRHSPNQISPLCPGLPGYARANREQALAPATVSGLRRIRSAGFWIYTSTCHTTNCTFLRRLASGETLLFGRRRRSSEGLRGVFLRS